MLTLKFYPGKIKAVKGHKTMTFKRFSLLFDTAKSLYEYYEKSHTEKTRQYTQLTFLINLLIDELRKPDGSYNLNDVKIILKKFPVHDSLFPYNNREKFIIEYFDHYARMGGFTNPALSFLLFKLKSNIIWQELSGLHPKEYKKNSMGYLAQSIEKFIAWQPKRRISQYQLERRFPDKRKIDFERAREYLKFKYGIQTHREGYKMKSLIYFFDK
jgi:hypothetical protein